MILGANPFLAFLPRLLLNPQTRLLNAFALILIALEVGLVVHARLLRMQINPQLRRRMKISAFLPPVSCLQPVQR